MVTLTDAAVNTLERVLAKSGGAAAGLRIAVADGGCAGMKYQMGLEATAGDEDAVLTFGPVTIFVDPTSQPFLTGVVVDFVEGVEGAGFKFDNPNATGSCGCGKSFSAGPGGSCSSAPTAGGCGTAH
ncbi:iron-sulfur cluster assembly protein [Azospirillum brasilense]|uniref:Iron-sulfur cluster assembly protein n=1 Tax=Azospirillum brasilense TaxID=192 RepID=A0A560C167_AZOBR|nr:iron-sulfur cluster assembly accessory protein [Azospirillum brasilense]MBK3737279.1 iron-sulfur cluster assembly accessory protein [Azospirillum brasilense]TWA78602.1 iron-sulfur cluster assembly protein [Azospirillum brasilense]